MKTYHGTRHPDRVEVTCDGEPLPLRTDLVNHSQGFEWGYAGSGPAQLALAILADYMCNVSTNPEDCSEEAVRLHQQFKAACIQVLPEDRWIITSDTVRNHLSRIRGQA